MNNYDDCFIWFAVIVIISLALFGVGRVYEAYAVMLGYLLYMIFMRKR